MGDDADDAFCNLPGPAGITGGAGKGQGPLLFPLVIAKSGGGAGIPFNAIGRGGGGGP